MHYEPMAGFAKEAIDLGSFEGELENTICQ